MLKRHYEILFLIDVIDFDKTKEEVLKLIPSHNGDIIKHEDLGIKDFSYPIKKKKKGFYFLVNVNFNQDSLAGFSKAIRLNENILRFLTILIKNKCYIRRGRRRLTVVDGQIQKSKNKKQDKSEDINLAEANE